MGASTDAGAPPRFPSPLIKQAPTALGDLQNSGHDCASRGRRLHRERAVPSGAAFVYFAKSSTID
jgi:hypothetical protein